MENKNEIVTAEETIEMVEEANANSSNSGLKIAGIALVASGIGYLLYRTVVKPVIAKVKANKKADSSHLEIDEDEFETE